jgi:hypothetical protein
VKAKATAGTTKISTTAPVPPKVPAAKQQPIALPGAAEIAARNNPLPKSSPDDAVKPETMTSAPAEKEKSIAAATTAAKSESKTDSSSAPASSVAPGTATPVEKEEVKEEDKKAEKEKEKQEESSEEETTSASKASKYDHLSVPASALHSGTATPAESEMEMENAFKETPTKEEAEKVFPDIASVAAGLQDMQLGEGKTTNEQEAKKAEDATKSVED